MKIPARFWLFFALIAGPSPALALECGKAATKVEKAICADANLLEADAEMAKAYASVREVSTAAERKMLALSQRRWIERRENFCAYGEEAELASCISGETNGRRLLLQGAPESGPGAASPLVPVFLLQVGTSKIYDVDYALLRFADPQSAGEKLFNAQTGKILNEAPLEPHGQDEFADMVLTREETFAISYASPDLLSVADSFYSNDGGAHGNGGVSNINIDMRSGKEINTVDVFAGDTIKTLTFECREQILQRKQVNDSAEKYVPEEDGNFQEGTIVDHISDFRRWTISAGKAVVTFDPYAIGSYAEGPYECVFDMARLKAIAKPDAPLPSDD